MNLDRYDAVLPPNSPEPAESLVTLLPTLPKTAESDAALPAESDAALPPNVLETPKFEAALPPKVPGEPDLLAVPPGEQKQAKTSAKAPERR